MRTGFSLCSSSITLRVAYGGLSSMKRIVQIPVAELAADLRNGTPDPELREKYGLSENGLKSLFDKFLKAISSGASNIQVEVKE